MQAFGPLMEEALGSRITATSRAGRRVRRAARPPPEGNRLYQLDQAATGIFRDIEIDRDAALAGNAHIIVRSLRDSAR